MKNKVIADQIGEEEIEKIELVSYRSNTGKERKKKSREKRWTIANFDNF